jgi:hypothetical protein
MNQTTSVASYWTQSITDGASSAWNYTSETAGRAWSWISAAAISVGNCIANAASSVHEFVVPRLSGFVSWIGQYPIEITVLTSLAVIVGVAGTMLATRLFRC